MDFLRRLHPGHADSAAAARLDRAPRWATSGEAPQAAVVATPFVAPAPNDVRAARSHTDVTAPLRSAGTELQRPARPLPVAAAAAVAVAAPQRSNPAPSQLPDRPVASHDGKPIAGQRALSAAPGRVGAAPLGAALFEHPRAVRETAPSTTPAEPLARNRPTREPPAPLRAQALQQAARAQRADAAPVVHVTIDRIDVRVPAPASAPAPTRKPRAASTAAPLGDYLRASGGRR
jgi:hypothetical protein